MGFLKNFALTLVVIMGWSACESQHSAQVDDADGTYHEPPICEFPEPRELTPAEQARHEFSSCITDRFFNSKPQTVGGTTLVNHLSGKPVFKSEDCEECNNDAKMEALAKELEAKDQRFVIIGTSFAEVSLFDKTQYAHTYADTMTGKTNHIPMGIIASYEACQCMQKHGISIGSKDGEPVIGLGKFAQENPSWHPTTDLTKYLALINRVPDDFNHQDLVGRTEPLPASLTFDQCRLAVYIQRYDGNTESMLLIGTGKESDKVEEHRMGEE